MHIREKVQQLLQGLCRGVYEKEEAIKLSLLAAVAGESVFLLGPPGVAKSLIARRLKNAFKDGTSFEYLMNKFSTPDEIFGPVSIKKLKDEDKYERLTKNYMPGANVVFLDEIWKAGPSIQNALLTIINEKVYRNGEEEVPVDIKCIISASNELPARGEGLEALWDRFLIRYLIAEIQEKGNFLNMITNTEDVYQDYVQEDCKITNKELEEWSDGIDQVEVPSEVLNTIQVIKHKLDRHDQKNETPFLIYDRRWKKIIRLLRASAFLNGRDKVDLMDCFLMVHCLWSEPLQLEDLKTILGETIRKHGYTIALNLTHLKKELEALEQEVKAETKIPHQETSEVLYLVDREYYEVVNVGKVFDGKYIKHVEFDRLGIEDFEAIGLYDENRKLTYKIKSRKSKIENHIDIYHNAQISTFPLKTTKEDRELFLDKPPHRIVKKYWDEQIAGLMEYVQAAQKRLQEEAPEEIKTLKANIFVDSSLSEIVEANMKDALESVHNLALRIEKIQHYYHQLGEA